MISSPSVWVSSLIVSGHIRESLLEFTEFYWPNKKELLTISKCSISICNEKINLNLKND